MFLSIIIPCYNCSGTITRTLESIHQASETEYEVILVDDCSTDNTIDVINEFTVSHEWAHLISLDSNQGPANARNVGIDASKGQYLAFVDSDDTITPNYIRMVSDVVLKEKADLVSIGISRVFGSFSSSIPEIDYRDQEEFLALVTGSLCSIVSSKTLWNGLRLPCIRNAEDIAVIPILISRARKVYHIKESLYNYILTPNSLSRKPSADVSFNFVKSFDFTCRYIDTRNDSYKAAIEFHGIKTVIYGGVLNAIKSGLPTKTINQMVDGFEVGYPMWNKNVYLEKYPLRKRFFLFCVRVRLFFIVRFFAFSHELFLGLRSRAH